MEVSTSIIKRLSLTTTNNFSSMFEISPVESPRLIAVHPLAIPLDAVFIAPFHLVLPWPLLSDLLFVYLL
jgi:hypothetical protein